MIDTLERGRDAIGRHAWAEAVEAFSEADRASDLSPEDLERLGTASWWLGQPDESNAALERAFSAYDAAGRQLDAANVAMTLSYQAFRGGAAPVGGGWLAQAGRLLVGQPETAVHARLTVFQIVGALEASHLEEAIALADRVIEGADRKEHPDALYMAMSFKGLAQLLSGNWKDGQANIDEAAAAATSGRLDLRVASDIFCNTIGACRSVGDLERAGQWAGEAERWMQRNSSGGYPGVCRIHRAEIKMLRGQWPEAEQEARQACDELMRFRLLDVVGYGQYQVGEIRLRMGDLDGASDAFDRAYEYGHSAQPGLAILQLARGEVEEASRSIGRALAATSTGGATDRATRGRLLPAQVDIALAAGDLPAAREAVEELESISAEFERPLFQAGALTARGELLLGEDRPSEASPVLGQSWRLWQTNDLPYESAQARLHYAEALIAEGDAATARRDLRAARSVFERLGANRELARVDALLADGSSGASPAVASGPAARVARTFMFTDIVTSTDLVGLIGDEAWHDVLGWHDRELRAAIAQHNGVEVSHTGDGFFVAFERAADGIECAVDIQRRLVRHRRDHGFAPWVRIGLHTAEATKRGQNFSGQGIHLAARVGTLATSEEIVLTSEVVRSAGQVRFGLSEPRSVKLKGIRFEVEVQSIDWR
jgi:class 3 adenylate cyclase